MKGLIASVAPAFGQKTTQQIVFKYLGCIILPSELLDPVWNNLLHIFTFLMTTWWLCHKSVKTGKIISALPRGGKGLQFMHELPEDNQPQFLATLGILNLSFRNGKWLTLQSPWRNPHYPAIICTNLAFQPKYVDWRCAGYSHHPQVKFAQCLPRTCGCVLRLRLSYKHSVFSRHPLT